MQGAAEYGLVQGDCPGQGAAYCRQPAHKGRGVCRLELQGLASGTGGQDQDITAGAPATSHRIRTMGLQGMDRACSDACGTAQHSTTCSVPHPQPPLTCPLLHGSPLRRPPPRPPLPLPLPPASWTAAATCTLCCGCAASALRAPPRWTCAHAQASPYWCDFRMIREACCAGVFGRRTLATHTLQCTCLSTPAPSFAGTHSWPPHLRLSSGALASPAAAPPGSTPPPAAAGPARNTPTRLCHSDTAAHA